METTEDIRQEIFREVVNQDITGVITTEAPGVLSGIQRARRLMESMGLAFMSALDDGSALDAGQEIAEITGNPIQIAKAEERLIGSLSKSSGIATAAHRALITAGSRFRVVSGGWKKMPFQIKDIIRQAARDGGIDVRISEKPFVYLDKNYVRILGGVKEAVRGAAHLKRAIVVQIQGETACIEDEALDAVQSGARVVMVDTGRRDDLESVVQALKKEGLRSMVQIAFAGSVTMNDLANLVELDLDIVDIGYAILDAPCLPMRFDVVKVA